MSTDQATTNARVELRVLGPIEAFLNGEPIALGGPVPRAIVARLAIAGGHMVADDTLIDDLWGDSPPRTASLTLQGYISTLRKAFEPNRGTAKPTVLVRRGPGYALVLPDDGLDSTRFLAGAHAGKEALNEQRFADAHRILGEALDLWRGPAHADCADRPFAQAEIRHLEERRLGVFEDRMDAAIALGENASAAAALEAHIRNHPLRERASELLALALYRAGRQGDALAALRATRESLADQLGADPRPSSIALHDAILRQDSALDVTVAEIPDARPPARHSLVPIPSTPLVGRHDDLLAVESAGATNRLVTLTGPGGMGKTRLALEVARRRRDSDGPWFVELADVREGGLLVDAIATALGVSVSGGMSSLEAILRDRRTLLVLDNCEQVLGPVAEFVAAVLASCSEVSVLATSREALGVHGEYV